VTGEPAAAGSQPHPLAGVDAHAALLDGRRRLMAIVDDLDESRARQVVHGEWRVHDLLTHLAAWDGLIAEFLRSVSAGEREFEVTAAPEDDWAAWNGARIAAAADARLAPRIEELVRARETLLDAFFSIDAAALDEEIEAPWGATDSVRGHVIVQAIHEAQHVDAIHEALSR
jgi:hypothetical protein